MAASETSDTPALPRISDATLRDTAHMAGVDLTPEDALRIATLLGQVGVDLVEVGIVSADAPRDMALVATVLDALGADRVMTVVLARSREQTRRDLELVSQLGCRAVMLSIPTSREHSALKLGTDDPRRAAALARVTIRDAKALGMTVTFSAEDGARTSPDVLAQYVATGAAAGADRFRLAETVSTLLPSDCRELVAGLTAVAGETEIEVHCHNMLGLAVANSIAAVEGGARWISATVSGTGERGGNTPLAEVLCCLRCCRGDDRYALEHLTPLTREVAARSGVAASPTAGPTGELSFCYEIPGQLRHPEAFEAIAAETVGNRRFARVRTRVTAALLDMCLPRDVAEQLDLDLVAADLSANPLAARGVWTEADLAAAGRQRLVEAGHGPGRPVRNEPEGP